MPFAFLAIAVLLIVIGVRGKTSDAIQLVQGEFTGPHSFVNWFLAIMILGSIGYYKPVRPVADAFIGLVILNLVLSKQTSNNIFQAFEAAVINPTAAPKVQGTYKGPSAIPPPVAPGAGGPAFDFGGAMSDVIGGPSAPALGAPPGAIGFLEAPALPFIP